MFLWWWILVVALLQILQTVGWFVYNWSYAVKRHKSLCHKLMSKPQLRHLILFVFETKCQEKGCRRKASEQLHDSIWRLRLTWRKRRQRSRLFLQSRDSLVQRRCLDLHEVITRFIWQGNNYWSSSAAVSQRQRPFNCRPLVFVNTYF